MSSGIWGVQDGDAAEHGSNAPQDLVAVLRDGRQQTLDSAVRRVALVGAPVGVLLSGTQLVMGGLSTPLMISVVISGVSGLLCLALALLGRGREGLMVLLGSLPLTGALAQLHVGFAEVASVPNPSMRFEALLVAHACICILGMRSFSRVFALLTVIPVGLFTYARLAWTDAPFVHVVGAAGLILVCTAVLFVTFEYLWQQEDAEQARLREHVLDLERAGQSARRIAMGDLSGSVKVQGGLAQEVEALRKNLGQAILQIRRAALEVGQAAVELDATAALQSGGMTEQSAAVAETRATVSHVSREAQDIESMASVVDERTKATLRQSGELERGLTELIRTTERSGELLDEVRGIADKSDLLALNASLEGVRAGEAGRGFALVAAQMQQLAERVRLTVDDLQALNAQVASHSQQSRTAMVATATEAEGAMLAATEIRERAARQGRAMSQVDQSVAEISEVTHRVASGTEQLRSASTRLVDLVRSIEQAVSTFELESETQAGSWR